MNDAEDGPGDDHASGSRTIRPKSSVRPEVGAQRVDRDQRAGVRRHQAVQHGQAGQGRDADLQHRQRRCGRPTSSTIGTSSTTPTSKNSGMPISAATPAIAHGSRRPDTRSTIACDDPVGAAGLGEQPADHRAERDQQPDAADGRTRRRWWKLVTMSARATPGDDAEHAPSRG